MVQPETVFSFGVLDLKTCTRTLFSKKSLYDYHVWAHLAVRRRSGQDHGIDEELPDSVLALLIPLNAQIYLVHIYRRELSTST